MLNKTAAEMKDLIRDYCRARINEGLCREDECEFCAVEDVYEMAKEDCGE